MRGLAQTFGGDHVTVITGAANGLGRALACAAAQQSGRLALADIRPDALRDTADRCRQLGAGHVVCADVDVANQDQVDAFAVAVVAEYGRVDNLVNNAGVLFTGDTDVSTTDDIRNVFDINFWGVVHGTKAFLPYLTAAPAGRLANVSSAFGVIAAPSYGAYNASKFAVRGFTEALQQEMQAQGSPLRVSCVIPGGLKTSIARTSAVAAGVDPDAAATQFEKIARTTPDHAAAVVLRGMSSGRQMILAGPDARLAMILSRVMGPRYTDVFRLARWATNRHNRPVTRAN